jgi:hypothetical protein
VIVNYAVIDENGELVKRGICPEEMAELQLESDTQRVLTSPRADDLDAAIEAAKE